MSADTGRVRAGASTQSQRTSPHLHLILAACVVVALFALSCSRSGAGTGGEAAAPAAGEGGAALSSDSGSDEEPGDSDDPESDGAGDAPWLVPDAPEVMPAVDTADPRLFMVGDSVLLAVGSTTEEMLPSWVVTTDAVVSRGVPAGRSVVAKRLPEIGEAAVVVLGHNYEGGGEFDEELDRIMLYLGDLERVVWVTVAEWTPDQIEVNRAIRAAHLRYDNVVVADWQALTVENPGYLQADDVHLTTSGTLALSDLIARAVGPGPLDVDPKMVRVQIPLAPDLPADYYTTSSTVATHAALVPSSSWVPLVAPTNPVGPSTSVGPATTLAPTTAPPTTVGPTVAPTTTVSD